MALTRKALKAMGIEDEKIEQIIEAHTETVSALKDEIDGYKADKEDDNKKVLSLESEIEKLKNAENPFESKYTKLKTEYDNYKHNVEEKELKAAKEKAVTAYFESKNIKGANLKIALRGAKDEISAIEITEDGAIKDTKALDKLVSEDFAGLVAVQKTEGADTPRPPQNTGGTDTGKSRAAELAAQYHQNLYGGKDE